jgi:hypothetical protein
MAHGLWRMAPEMGKTHSFCPMPNAMMPNAHVLT